MIKKLAMFLALSQVITAQAAPTKSGTSKAAASAFADMNSYFIKQYDAQDDYAAENYRPLVIAGDTEYTLYLKDGTIKKFPPIVTPFSELKAVSHIMPGLFAIGLFHWRNPNDSSWKSKLRAYASKVKKAMEATSSVDWSSPAWPNDAEKLRDFVYQSLEMVDTFALSLLKKNEYTKEDYMEFARHYLNSMISTMYLASVSTVTQIGPRLKEWKAELGEEEWKRVYFILVGSTGRGTAGLTIATNPAASIISSTMDPDLVNSHIIIEPNATSYETAKGGFGAVLNDLILAQLAFTTPQAKKAGGVYDALQSSTTNLPKASLDHVVDQETIKGKIRIPALEILPKDQDYVKKLAEQ